MAKFFITCPINFEKLCERELKLKWNIFFNEQLPEITLVTGGIELDCELQNGLALNHILKTASRILLRLKEQKCRDVPKLFNIIRKFNWKEFLKKEEVNWHITTHKSRLINTTKMQNACEDGLKSYFQANALSKKIKESTSHQTQNIYIRVSEDLLTLSLDTSGELLHIRGNRSFRGHASIRENIASALLIHLLENNLEDNLENATNLRAKTPFSLLDPMCGTGTFLSEAHDFFNLSSRRFAYYDWYTPFQSNARVEWNIQLYGHDIDNNILTNIDLPFAKLTLQDAFKITDNKADNKNVDYLICNPPYGKRIKLDRAPQKFFSDLIVSLLKGHSPKKMGILIPATVSLNLKKILRDFPNYKTESILPFNNNGIKIDFHVISYRDV